MSDIFEDMRALVGCTYISDLRICPDIVQTKLHLLELTLYPSRQLEDFAQYIFGNSDSAALETLQSDHKSL